MLRRPPCSTCTDTPRPCTTLCRSLLGTANFPHGSSYYQPHVQMASLDHALWFHRPFRADDWLLYSIDSPRAQGSRGLARGLIYDRDGQLVARTAQEGLTSVTAGEASRPETRRVGNECVHTCRSRASRYLLTIKSHE